MHTKLLTQISILIMVLYGSPAFSIFCPNNFNSVNLGDSLDSVLQTCGTPLSQTSHQEQSYTSQEWVYYVNQGFNQGTATLRIVFSNNLVVNISLTANYKNCVPPQNGFGSAQSKDCIWVVNQRTLSLPNTNVCGGYISINDSTQSVQNACGQPSFVNTQGEPSSEKTITELIYSGPPSTKLIFENGLLINRIQN